MTMNTANNPPQECQQAQALQLLALTGADMDAAAQTTLDAHLGTCATCAQFETDMSSLDVELTVALGSLNASPDFTARTMEKLPQLAPAKPVIQAGPKVFAAQQAQISWLPRVAVAAVMLLMSGVAFVATRPGVSVRTENKTAGVQVRKGELRDASGKRADKLQLNVKYAAAEDSIVPLSAGSGSVVRIQKGAQFMLQAGKGNLTAVRLAQGDLYAAGQTSHEPVHVLCEAFETELQHGNMFVGDNPGSATSIVIVFAGSAKVTSPDRGIVALQAGEIFCSLALETARKTQTLAIADLPKLKEGLAGNDAHQNASLRAIYAKRVDSYQEELTTLDKEIAAAQNDETRAADLKDRRQRVESYLAAHKQKLFLMSNTGRGTELPLRLIEKGLDGYSDPAGWL